MRNNTIQRGFIHTLLLVLLLSFSFHSAGYAEEEPAFDYDSSGSMVIIPLENSAVDAAKEFVQQIQASNVVRISAMVYAPPGTAAKLVLSGSQSDLQQALELYQKLVYKKTSGHLVVIAASLRELTKSDIHDVGLNLFPTIGAISKSTWARGKERSQNDDSSPLTMTKNWTDNRSLEVNGTWTDMANLNKDLNKSKVLVSSEVYTSNGVKAQISNVKSVPIFTSDSNGNVATQYENLETSIGVVPTIIKYNPEKPEESLIRVDVEVKVSIISSTQTFRNYSAPEHSVKTMTTTRMLTADNQSNVIGTFVTDSDVKRTSGIPILGKLPLLKYLFSQEHKEKERSTAVLTLSVRLLPVPCSIE